MKRLLVEPLTAPSTCHLLITVNWSHLLSFACASLSLALSHAVDCSGKGTLSNRRRPAFCRTRCEHELWCLFRFRDDGVDLHCQYNKQARRSQRRSAACPACPPSRLVSSAAAATHAVRAALARRHGVVRACGGTWEAPSGTRLLLAGPRGMRSLRRQSALGAAGGRCVERSGGLAAARSN